MHPTDKKRGVNKKNNDPYNRFYMLALGTNNRSRSIALYNGTTIYRTDPILRSDIKTWHGSIRVAHTSCVLRDVLERVTHSHDDLTARGRVREILYSMLRTRHPIATLLPVVNDRCVCCHAIVRDFFFFSRTPAKLRETIVKQEISVCTTSKRDK